MSIYAEGTHLESRMPWGLYVGGRALCSDGKVRALVRIAQTADTFFSVPASVQVGRKTIAGYVTTIERDNGARVVVFHAYSNRKNGHLLPFNREPK